MYSLGLLLAPVYSTGVIHHLRKDYDKAEELYSRALQLDANLSVAKDNLKKLLKSRHKRNGQ